MRRTFIPALLVAAAAFHASGRTMNRPDPGGRQPAPGLVERLSLEKHARKGMPPVFIAATQADKSVPVENSLLLYQALRRAGVPAELHLYAAGSHGDSLDPQYGPTALWPLRCEEWMRFNGWLPPAAR